MTQFWPNVVVECLSLLLRIWEAPGSNLDPEAGYPEGFRSFFQSLPRECREGTLKLGNDLFFQNPSQFMTDLSSFHSTLYSLRYVSLNKLKINK
jgi:hypothetical protein